jgi:hypothetical protein
VVSGSFELSRLRDLFADQFEPATRRPSEEQENGEGEPHPADSPEQYDLRKIRASDLRDHVLHNHDLGKTDLNDSRSDRVPRDTRDDPTALRLPEHYESTTLGGLVSEIAGHIPLPGEVVVEDGLRLEVLASTDRRIDRIRVSLTHPPAAA